MAPVPIYEKHFQAVGRALTNISSSLRLTVGEFLFISSFVTNFFIGKVVHLVSPEEEVYNYYNDKRNILNQLFVKKGWGWTTVAIVIFYGLQLNKRSFTRAKSTSKANSPSTESKASSSSSSLILMAVARYLIATVWWIFFTQWFFGFPIMDRLFVLTGGQCVIEQNEGHPFLHLFQENEVGKFGSMHVSSYHCRRIRGSWEGGHDPSGHVFLMVHSSLYMFMEGISLWTSWTQFTANIRNLVTGIRLSLNKIGFVAQFLVENPHIILMQLTALWWFMLLMTNIYFHSIAEKLVGLAFGYFGVFAVYLFPRYLK